MWSMLENRPPPKKKRSLWNMVLAKDDLPIQAGNNFLWRSLSVLCIRLESRYDLIPPPFHQHIFIGSNPSYVPCGIAENPSILQQPSQIFYFFSSLSHHSFFSTFLLGGELPTNRKWVSSHQFFEWTTCPHLSHWNHQGWFTRKNDSLVVHHQVNITIYSHS